LNVCATTEDGIIEAYENPNHPFCIGVQWHPEFMTSEIDNKLFQEFINKTTIYKQNKNINVK
jgi:putative glutamine amidotransferase